MIKADIEEAGLETLLVGLRHPAYRGNPLFKALYVALSLEWSCRQTKDETPKPIELPKPSTLTDEELRESAGFLYGLCCSIDVEQYQRTFWFCFALLQGLAEETELRSPAEGLTVH